MIKFVHEMITGRKSRAVSTCHSAFFQDSYNNNKNAESGATSTFPIEKVHKYNRDDAP